MACVRCRTLKKIRYPNFSPKQEVAHLVHANECIDYANMYLILLLTGKLKLNSSQKGLLLSSLSGHKLILKHYILHNRALFTKLFLSTKMNIEKMLLVSSLRGKHFRWIMKNKDLKQSIENMHTFINILAFKNGGTDFTHLAGLLSYRFLKYRNKNTDLWRKEK